jgi:hypothetical protein
MASENTEQGKGMESSDMVRALIRQAEKLTRDLQQTNGPGPRGRALSVVLTKLDEARLWLREAVDV